MVFKVFLSLIIVLVLSHQHIDSQEYWVPFYEKGSWGVKDGKGDLIHPASWDSIILDNPVNEYFDDLILYQVNSKYGIFSIDGRDILKPEWDAVYFNPGLGYDYNVTKTNQTLSGNLTVNYQSIALLEEFLNKSYSTFPLYFIVTRKENDLFLFDSKFKRLIEPSVSDIYVETDMFIDFGLMLIEKNNSMGILYKSGKKFTGFKYDTVCYWHSNDSKIDPKKCYLKIDGQIVKYSVKGKFDFNQANLVIPRCIGQVSPYTDTKSWIYDFTVENGNLMVIDGMSNVYCFSSEKELHWVKEIPNIYSYSPVSCGKWIIIGNYVFDKEDIRGEPVLIPGNKILHPAVYDHYILYISDTDPSSPFESTEIPGLQDINPSMMGSSKKIICYNINNQSVVWNRSLDINYPENVSFQIYKDKIVMPVFGPADDPRYFLLTFNLHDGAEVGRNELNTSRQVQVSGNTIYLKTYCMPEMEVFCDDTEIKAYRDIELSSPEAEISVPFSGHTYIHGDTIFYLRNTDEIIVINSKNGKKLNKLSLEALGSRISSDEREDFILLNFNGDLLFFMLNGEHLYSVDLNDGKIAKYAFYVDREYTSFKTRYTFIQDRYIYMRDQYDRINIFELPVNK